MATSDMALTALLRDAGSVPEIYEALKSFAVGRDFDFFLFGLRVPLSLAQPVHFLISGYPKEWRKRYDELGFVRLDPIVRHALASTSPVFWDDIDRSSAIVSAFFREAGEYGLSHGVSAPVCGHRGEVGVLSLSRPDPIAEDEQTRFELAQQMSWFSAVIYQAVSRVAFSERTPDVPVRLSEREKQILMWTATGATSARIAGELGIAERTVLFHIEKAGKKMGVTGRHKIVSHAVGSGALQLNQVALQSPRMAPTTREFSF